MNQVRAGATVSVQITLLTDAGLLRNEFAGVSALVTAVASPECLVGAPPFSSPS